jgi:L-malate glycosyltransferase
VIHHREYSGAEIMHLPLLRSDTDALVACPPGSPTEELVRSAGCETAPLPFRQLRHSGGRLETLRSTARGLLAARDLRRVLRAHPDRSTVYAIALRPGMLAAVAALGLRRRIVWYLPDCLPPRGVVRALAVGLALARAHRVIAISDFVARDASALRRRISIVRPGVEAGLFADAKPDPGAARAVILGHISPTKRTDLAVEIAARVAEQTPAFRLEVVGRAQYRGEDFAFQRDLERRVEGDPALRDVVRFCGYSRDVTTSFDGVGLLLHCRDDEPFGIVLLEAMAAGLPVVAPARGGPREIVVDGRTGFLYPPGDADAAAAAVNALVADPVRARRMGEEGRERVRRLFDATHQTGLLAETITADPLRIERS